MPKKQGKAKNEKSNILVARLAKVKDVLKMPLKLVRHK
jgi:hypothetical protein